MNAGRTVFISVAVSMVLFMVAGGRFEKVVAKLGGRPPEQGAAAETVAKTFVAWAFILVTLSVMADFEATAKLAQAFALLILLSMVMAYGVDAFAAIARLVGGGNAPVNDGRAGAPKPSNRNPEVR